MVDLPPNSNVTTQQESAQSELKQLSRNDESDSFKSVRLRAYIDKIIRKNERLGVATGTSIIDLQTQQSIVGHNLDTEHFAASINKVPIAALILNDLRSGRLTFDQVLTWEPSDVRAGKGVYDQPGAPLQATVEALLYDLLNPSGNTAVRILVNQGMGGAAGVNVRITNELHLSHTYLQPVDANRFYLGNTTARESLSAMRQLVAVQDTYGRFVKNAMATNIYADYGVRSQLAGNDYIVLSNKVGILDDVDGNNRHDVGLVYNTRTHKAYGYAFLNTAMGEPYNTATSQASVSLADMGAGLLRQAGDKKVHDTVRPLNLNQIKPEDKVRF